VAVFVSVRDMAGGEGDIVWSVANQLATLNVRSFEILEALVFKFSDHALSSIITIEWGRVDNLPNCFYTYYGFDKLHYQKHKEKIDFA
jgi:hypothetical protein